MVKKLLQETRINPTLSALAAYGALEGAFKYYVKPELTARRAWLAIGATVLAHDFLCPQGQTLSEGADRALEGHPVLTTMAIGVVAGHLANIIPPQIDPIHRAVEILKGKS